jgi:hypothetical protein
MNPRGFTLSRKKRACRHYLPYPAIKADMAVFYVAPQFARKRAEFVNHATVCIIVSYTSAHRVFSGTQLVLLFDGDTHIRIRKTENNG